MKVYIFVLLLFNDVQTADENLMILGTPVVDFDFTQMLHLSQKLHYTHGTETKINAVCGENLVNNKLSVIIVKLGRAQTYVQSRNTESSTELTWFLQEPNTR